MCRFDSRSYFDFQTNSKLKSNDESKSKLALMPRFVLKVSDVYYVRDKSLIKSKLAKRNLIKSFAEDIQRDVEIADSPSRIKRYASFKQIRPSKKRKRRRASSRGSHCSFHAHDQKDG